jgi:protein TonB
MAGALAASLVVHVALLSLAVHLVSPPAPAVTTRVFPILVIREEPQLEPTDVAASPRSAPERTPPPRDPPRQRRSAPTPAPRLAPATAPAVELEPAPSLPATEPTSATAGDEPSPVGAAPPRLHALFQPAPRYPHAARRRGAEGTTWLRVELAPTGRVVRVDVERSAGHRDLDSAAVAAVRTWRFARLPEGMDSSDLWFRIPVDFRLR